MVSVITTGENSTIQFSQSYASTSGSFTVAPVVDTKNYRKITVYQAGPIDSCTESEIHDWREVLKMNHPDINWLDPSVRTYKDPLKEWKALVEEDLKEIIDSDAMLAYVWRTSCGTSMELVYAHSILHIPVVVVVNDINNVGPWVQYHADFITDNFNEACTFIRNKI